MEVLEAVKTGILYVLIIAVIASFSWLVVGFEPKHLTYTLQTGYTLIVPTDAVPSKLEAKIVKDCLAAAQGQPVLVIGAVDGNDATTVSSCVAYPSITGMQLQKGATKDTLVYTNTIIPLKE
jgi:hypothetical protein